MISLQKISDTEYYTDPDIDDTPSLDLKPRQKKKRKHKDLDASYSEIEKRGSWQILTRDSDWKNGQDTIFESVSEGDNVDPHVLQLLFSGRHPQTSETLPGKRKKGGRGGAVDIQMSVPKSFSILMSLAPQESGVRDTLKTIMREAHRHALDFAFRASWFVTRRAGRFEPVAACAIAGFQHYTSRADEPNGHSHNLTLKTALRSDGALCQLEPYILKRHLSALAAVARSYEIAMLHEAGFRTEPRGRNYEICGVPEDLRAAFSTRRAQIEDGLRDLGRNSDENRAAAQFVAFETRPEKSGRTEHQLQQTWQAVMRDAGWTPDALLASTRAAAAEQTLETAPSLERVVREALDSLTEHEAVFDRPKLLRAVFETTQHFGFDPDAVVSCVEKHVVAVAAPGQLPVYTTPGMRRAEETLLKMVLDSSVQLKTGKLRHDMPTTGSDPDDTVTLTDEQQAAVRHVTKSNNQLVVVSGRAGAGKSTAMRAARQIFETEGRRVWGTAASWQATNALRETLNLPPNQCFATAALLAGIRKGTLALAPGDVLLLDEAGMLGTRDFLDLLTKCRDKQVKLVALGDENQLKPVAAGAPFQLLQRVLPLKRIDTIQRQHVGEMRFATAMLSRGNVSSGLGYYDDESSIGWCKTADDAIRAAVAAYCEHRLTCPNETRVLLVDWNRDARRVNEAVRDRLRAAGEIEKSEVYIDALGRGGDKSTVIRLPISVGDTLIFGETLQIQGAIVRNGDLGTVAAIDMASAKPVFTIALRDGQTFQATADNMIGTRAADDKRPRLPMLQHGYALTAHAAQGLTVDACYDVSLRQRGVESTYVCGSRHRQSYRKFIDLGRVERDARRSLENRHGAGVARTRTLTKDDLKEEFYYQSSRGDHVNNALDFLTRDELLEIADGSLGVEREAKAPEETSRVVPLAERIAQLKAKPAVAKRRAHALRRAISADRSRQREVAHWWRGLMQHADRTVTVVAPARAFRVPDWTKPLPTAVRDTAVAQKGKALWDQIFGPSSPPRRKAGSGRVVLNRVTWPSTAHLAAADAGDGHRAARKPSQVMPIRDASAQDLPIAKSGVQQAITPMRGQTSQSATAKVSAHVSGPPRPEKPAAAPSTVARKPGASQKAENHRTSPDTHGPRDATKPAEKRQQTETVKQAGDKKSRDRANSVPFTRRMVNILKRFVPSRAVLTSAPAYAPAPAPKPVVTTSPEPNEDNNRKAKQRSEKPDRNQMANRKHTTQPVQPDPSHRPPKTVLIDLIATEKKPSQDPDLAIIITVDELAKLDLSQARQFMILSPDPVSSDLLNAKLECDRIAKKKHDTEVQVLCTPPANSITPRVVQFDCTSGRMGHQLHGDVLRVTKGSGADIFPSGVDPSSLAEIEIIGDESEHLTLRRMKIVEQNLKLFQSTGLLSGTVKISRSQPGPESEEDIAQNAEADPDCVEMHEILTELHVEPAEPDEPSLGM